MSTGDIKRIGSRGLAALALATAIIGCGDPAGVKPDEIATIQGTPGGIVADGTYVYWAVTFSVEGGSIQRAPIGTPAAETFADVQDAPYDLQLHEGSLYWTNRGTGGTTGAIMSKAISGGTPERLIDQQALPNSLAFGTASNTDPVLYWTTDGDAGSPGEVKVRAVGATGNGSVIASEEGRSPEGVATGGDGVVYWTEPTYGAVRVLQEGGSAQDIATAQDRPRGIAADGAEVYWTTAGTEGNGAVMHATAGPDAVAAPIAGGVSVAGLGRIAIDDDYVYWLGVVGSDHAVMRAPRSGGKTPQTLSTAPGTATFGIFVDKDRVYWTASDGIEGHVYSIVKN